MIENKWNLRADEMSGDYRPRIYFLRGEDRRWARTSLPALHPDFITKSVDNFVKK